MAFSDHTLHILPGTMCNHLMFDGLIQNLTAQHIQVNVIEFTTETTIDEMVESTLQAMDGKNANLLGFSMGGIVALALVKKHPELVNKLCLLSSNSHADLPERKAPRMQFITEAKATTLSSVILKHFLPNYFYTNNDKHNTLITQMAEALGTECFESQLNALSTREDTLNVLENIHCPVAIIAGKQDKLCNVKHQQLMHQHCQQSDLFLLANCGHFPTLERSNTTSAIIEDWLLR